VVCSRHANCRFAARNQKGVKTLVLSLKSRVALLSFSSLAALGSLVVVGPGSAAAASAPIHLVWTVWGSPLDTATYQLRANEYHALHPNVSISVINLPQYDQQVETMIAGGKSPDIMNVAQDGVGFGVNGAVENLAPLIKESHFNLDRFSPGYIGEYSYRGAIYGLPDRGGYSMIFFNKALFRAAHIPYPTSDWTWADFLRDAQKMTIVKDGKTVQWGFAGSGWWPYFGALVHEAGGNFINANETSGTVSSPATQAGLNFANDLAFKWHVTPTPVEAANFGANGPNIARGNIGMNMDSFWDIKTLYASLGQNLGMAPFPKDKTGGMETVGTGVAIAAQSKYIQADWDFLQWLSTPAGQRQIVINHEDMPATKYGLSLWIKTLPKGLSYSLLAPDAKDVFSPRIPPTWTQLQTVEGNDLTPFWDGKTTIAALAPKLDQDISGVLNSGQ